LVLHPERVISCKKVFSVIRKLPTKDMFDVGAATDTGSIIRGNPLAIALTAMTKNIVPIRFLNA
jgi:hypothetical protein